MKLTIIYSGIYGYEQKMDKVLKIIRETLSELDKCEINNIMLSDLSVPYYDGKNADVIANYVENIKDSKGVIFATTAPAIAPNALMINFLEHLMDKQYRGLLENKSCLIVVTSHANGERISADIISNAIGMLKGFDAGRIMIGKAYLQLLEENDDLKEIIERQIEDYYRVIRQNRKFFIPAQGPEELDEMKLKTPLSSDKLQKLFGEERIPRVKTEEIYKKYNFSQVNEKQEKDINEITKFYAKKYNKGENSENLIPKGNEKIDIDYSNTMPRQKTCKQITQSLPHYFKPQLASDLDIIFQLIINAKEAENSFDGYITVENGECTFNEGQAEKIDITIISDEDSWLDVVKGKNTAQKAFMIGKLKVRGNFLFLSKMDQIFNFSIAVV